jgi:hypothetical protein
VIRTQTQTQRRNLYLRRGIHWTRMPSDTQRGIGKPNDASDYADNRLILTSFQGSLCGPATTVVYPLKPFKYHP